MYRMEATCIKFNNQVCTSEISEDVDIIIIIIIIKIIITGQAGGGGSKAPSPLPPAPVVLMPVYKTLGMGVQCTS